MVNFKQTFCSVFLSLFLITTSLALPDLTVTAFSINKTSIVRGDYFIATATIKNIGNQTSVATFASITIEGVKTAKIATKSLASNESATLQYVLAVPSSAFGGNHSVTLEVDSENLVSEGNELNNLFCPGTTTCQKLFVTNDTYLPDRKISCPIIFIHGLNDDDVTWYPFAIELSERYGLSSGGNFDFFLNPDRDLTKGDSRLLIQGLGQFESRLIGNGDFYFVNFNVSRYGGVPYPSSNMDLSNQSAIYKQGFALQNVVKRVRELTGAAEVILMGHSMGGLAARQYIQDSTNWQSDGKHHIAKLVTVGTPHGGSNLAGGLISKWSIGTDEKSEAVRDLRHPSFSSRFLFNGSESGITEGYYNKDVNCNGSSNDYILGLNSKSFPSDIAAACVIGTGIQSLCRRIQRVVTSLYATTEQI